MGDLTPFAEIFASAAARKGGAQAFAETLPRPEPVERLLALGDDRWLSGMSKSVFKAGFNWAVIDNKWSRFEEVFEGFEPARMAMMSDDDLDRYLKADGIVRHAAKILSIRDNAAFLRQLAVAHGTGGRAIATWPTTDFVGLLWMLKKRGSRLGGSTGMYFLRFAGVDSFILSRDVVRALQREGVVDGEPSSKRDLDAVQAAVNAWAAEFGQPLTAISRVLACSVE